MCDIYVEFTEETKNRVAVQLEFGLEIGAEILAMNEKGCK